MAQGFFMDKKVLAVVLCSFLSGCASTTKKHNQVNLDSYQRLISNRADNVDLKEASALNVELGISYMAQGDLPRAKRKIVHALELNENSAEANAAMAYFMETTGEAKKAEEYYLNAIRFAVKNQGAHFNNYGIFLCSQKRYKEAQSIFSRGINDKKYFDTARIYENAGICALENKDLAKAREFLETAILKAPKSSKNAYLSMANVSLGENKPYEAMHYLKRFEKINEPTAKSTLSFIQVAEKIKDNTLMKQKENLLKEHFADTREFVEYNEKFNGK